MYSLHVCDIQTDQQRLLAQYDNLDIVAGMLAISAGLFATVNSNYYLISDADVSNYRVFKNIAQENIPHFTRLYYQNLSLNEFAIWLADGVPTYYSLYKFRSIEFVQGMETLCQSFGKNMIDYRYLYVFDNTGEAYTFDDETPYRGRYQVPKVYDLDDVDDEEEGNENVETLYELE